jgi:hypothetical protein
MARRLAGNDALYWRRREFGYPSQYRVDATRQSPTHPGAGAGAADRQLTTLRWIKDVGVELIHAMTLH